MHPLMFCRTMVIGLVLFAACKDTKPADKAPTPTTGSADAATAMTSADASADTRTPDAAPAEPTGAGSAAAAPATDEEAAALVYAAVADPAKADAAAALLPAGKQVKLVERGGGSGKKSFEGVAGLRDAFKDANATAMKLGACKQHCCDFKPEFDDERSLGMQVRKVCFDDKRVLTTVEVTYEN